MSAALFKKKELEPCKRVCLRLKQLREEHMVSLAEMAARTNISRQHLEAIETCDFKKLPDGVIYHKNFVRRYLEALGIDPAPYITQFQEEETQNIPHPKKGTPRRISFLQFGNLPATIRLCAIAVVMLIFVGYLGYQVKRIVEPPALTLVSPQNGMVSDQQSILVQGTTEQEALITINGEAIQNSEHGTFEQLIDLSPGLNTITIVAQKKHGKTTQETRYIVLRANQDNI